MYCPSCGAEYRAGFTICSDCQVPLAPDSTDKPAQKESSNDKDLVLVWSGTDPSRLSDVLEILSEENIAARTVNREEYLLYANTHQTMEVYVPSEFAARATQILHESKTSQEAWDELAESGALEIPAEDDSPEEKNEPGADATDDEDAMVEIWSGANSDLAGMIAMSLRENQIAYTGDPEADPPDPADLPDVPGTDGVEKKPSLERLFVHSKDEKRGKEIVREILDAQPPA